MPSIPSSDSGQLKIAVIGIGSISEIIHIPSIHASPEVKLSMLVDPYADEARIRDIAKQYGCHWARQFDPATADFAIIATPISNHYQTALTAVRAGKSVLVEKPLTAQFTDAKNLIDTAEANQARVFCGQVRRFYRNTNTVRQVIKTGAIGELRKISVHEGNLYGWNRRFHHEKEDKFVALDQGVLFDVGSHSIDTLAFILEEVMESWSIDSAFTTNMRLQSDVHVIASCRLKGAHHPVALEVSLSNSIGLANVIWFRGDHGTIALPVNPAQPPVLFTQEDKHTGIRLESGTNSALPPHLEMLDSIFSSLASGDPSVVDGSRVIETVRFLDEAFQNLQLGKCPWL